MSEDRKTSFRHRHGLYEDFSTDRSSVDLELLLSGGCVYLDDWCSHLAAVQTEAQAQEESY